ncbi:MAG: toxin-antitoxin system YwqK family antitoxin [Candidatus Omnitrophica bacterium]|nr:toxin-antitoxin system YwqK family antitoxin [Candidatus Omnitrophota bacterium]
MQRIKFMLLGLFLMTASYSYADQNLLNGIKKDYYPNGKLKLEAEYKDGKQNGILREYYENGQLAFIQTIRNGKVSGMVKAYYESGKLKGEVNYVDSLQDGKCIEYYENSKVKEETTFIEGQIINIKKFDEQGNMTLNQNDNFGPGCVFYEEVQS